MTHTDVVSHRSGLHCRSSWRARLLASRASPCGGAVTARGSVEQVQVTGAKHGGSLSANRRGASVQMTAGGLARRRWCSAT